MGKKQTLLAACLGLSVLLMVWWSQANSSPPIEEMKISSEITTAIVDATIYTMKPGEKPFVGVVLIEGNKVKAVGKRIAIPQGSVVINARGKVVTPGLAIANTRLGLVEIGAERSTRNDFSSSKGRLHPAFHVQYGFNHRTSLLPVARSEGITSVMVRPIGGLISGLSMLVDLHSKITSRNVRKTLGMHATIRAGQAADWLVLQRAMAEARFYLNYKGDYKMGNTRKLTLSQSQLLAMSRVVQRHIPLLLEVHRSSDILTAIRFAKNQKIRLILVGVSEGWMVAKELARSHIPVILQPPSNLPRRFDRLGSRNDNAAKLYKAGVLFAFGAQSGAHNIRSLRHEAGIYAAYGLPQMEAIRALTHHLYAIFQLTQHYGSIEKGKTANVVLWTGDPLELSSFAEHVWIRGELMPKRTRQTMLRERYRKLNHIYQQHRTVLPVNGRKKKPS